MVCLEHGTAGTPLPSHETAARRDPGNPAAIGRMGPQTGGFASPPFGGFALVARAIGYLTKARSARGHPYRAKCEMQRSCHRTQVIVLKGFIVFETTYFDVVERQSCRCPQTSLAAANRHFEPKLLILMPKVWVADHRRPFSIERLRHIACCGARDDEQTPTACFSQGARPAPLRPANLRWNVRAEQLGRFAVGLRSRIGSHPNESNPSRDREACRGARSPDATRCSVW